MAGNNLDDKNYMSMRVEETNGEMRQLLDKLKSENQLANDLQLKVKTQEIEIKTLVECVENLRQNLVQTTEREQQKNPEYVKYDQMLTIYKDSARMIDKIKKERSIEVQKDVFEVAMLKISKKTEIKMLNIQMKQLMEEHAADINWKQLGLGEEDMEMMGETAAIHHPKLKKYSKTK